MVEISPHPPPVVLDQCVALTYPKIIQNYRLIYCRFNKTKKSSLCYFSTRSTTNYSSSQTWSYVLYTFPLGLRTVGVKFWNYHSHNYTPCQLEYMYPPKSGNEYLQNLRNIFSYRWLHVIEDEEKCNIQSDKRFRTLAKDSSSAVH